MIEETPTIFDLEFSEICHDLIVMSEMIIQAIDHSMIALHECNIELANEIIANDKQVNAQRFKIEEASLQLIAIRQPIAGDLRSVIAVMHIVVEMERMGDHAAGIAKTVIRMEKEPLLKTYKKIKKMGELSSMMLSECIQAFLNKDITRANEIAAQDSKMDGLYKEVFDRLMKLMANKPEMVSRATYLLWCAHNLERIADRVTNVAERVVFMATGDLSEFNP